MLNSFSMQANRSLSTKIRMLQKGEKLLNKRLDLHSVFFSSMVLFVTQDLPSTLAQFKTCLLQTGDPEATPE